MYFLLLIVNSEYNFFCEIVFSIIVIEDRFFLLFFIIDELNLGILKLNVFIICVVLLFII